MWALASVCSRSFIALNGAMVGRAIDPPEGRRKTQARDELRGPKFSPGPAEKEQRPLHGGSGSASLGGLRWAT